MSNRRSLPIPITPKPAPPPIVSLEIKGSATVAWERFRILQPDRARRIEDMGFFIRDEDAPTLLAFAPGLLVLVRFTGNEDGRQVVPLRLLGDVERSLEISRCSIRDVSLRVIRS